MLTETRLETVKPEIKEYIFNLAKMEQELYLKYINNKITICEDGETYNKEKSYLNQYIVHFIGNKYGKAEANKILQKINKKEKEEKVC